jgi:hypothetical protein
MMDVPSGSEDDEPIRIVEMETESGNEDQLFSRDLCKQKRMCALRKAGVLTCLRFFYQASCYNTVTSLGRTQMVRAKSHTNGRLDESARRLEEAMTNMLQTQVALSQTQAETLADIAATQRDLANLRRSSDERFAQIMSTLNDHSRILAELVHFMHALPEAVRDKMGFRVPETPAGKPPA